MAVATPSENFLTKKAGPMPVWAWGGVGLGIAWIYAKYKANKASSSSASSTSGTSSAAEPSTGAEPYYVIENNIPQASTSPVNVTVGGTSAPPTTTPVGTTPTPPTTPVPTQGGNPPRGPHPPVPVGSPTPTPTKPTAPSPQKYTVQKGDTLWGIAQKFYGNGAQYTNIWTYNLNAATRKAAGLPAVQGNNPNLIYPGEVFLIPPKS